MLTTKELEKCNIEDLQEKLEEQQAEFQKVKLQHASNELTDVSLIRKNKKQIARIKTIIANQEAVVQGDAS